ncbi:unnamed protein product, partial [Prorocentrum cordatum]
MSGVGLEEKVGMAAGALPAAWRPSGLRAQEILALGASAARRAARLRRQHACEAALRKLQADGLVAPGSWRDRELAARPALMLLAEGLPVPGGRRRRTWPGLPRGPDGDSGSLEGPQADAEVIQGIVEESSESIVQLDLERQDSVQNPIEYLEWVALPAAALKRTRAASACEQPFVQLAVKLAQDGSVKVGLRRLCSKGHVLDRDSNPFDDPLPCAACGIMIPVDG